MFFCFVIRCLQRLGSCARKYCLINPWFVAISPLELAILFSTLEGFSRGESNGMGRIRLGYKVTLFDLQVKEPFSFYLVQSSAGDPGSAKVSCLSPLGTQLIGRTLGDVVEVKIFGRTERFRIVGVEH